MLRALLERDIVPDLVLGTSVGALNGAMVARQPDARGGRAAHRPVGRHRAAAATCTATARCARSAGPSPPAPTSTPPRRCATRLEEELGDTRFEDLPVRLEVCAASIERAAEHWFTTGPIVPAILASAAVPGLLPPAEIDGEHFLDGGLVNSIPVGRAVELGATRVFVLQVGRIDRPLKAADAAVGGRPGQLRGGPPPPLHARHGRPSPTGSRPTSCRPAARRRATTRCCAHRDFGGVQARIDATYAASRAYLDERARPAREPPRASGRCAGWSSRRR